MNRLITILFSLFAMLLITEAQNNTFEKKLYQYRYQSMPYRILYPDNYDRNKSYPLMVFLHGAGERGNDNESQLVHGSKLFTDAENRQQFPAIVIFPQCPKDEYWAPIKTRENGFSYVDTKKPTEPMQLLIRLIDELRKNEAVDNKRMYVAGLSMGGMGTYDLICRYPKKFAAAIVICGGVSNERLKKVTKMPIRIYHGADDQVVSQQHALDAYIELKANGAQNVELFIFPGVNHNSWDTAFEQPDFLDWLFAQKKH